MIDPIRHLDRAFAPPPTELSEALERAFERGEMTMKKRHKYLTALAVATGMAAAFAVIALAGSQLARTTPDRVAPAQVAAENSPASSDGGIIYYATANGNYFHTDSQCRGMEDALPMTGEAALLMGKSPCPICCRDGMDLCWSTEQGSYYHMDRTCMGMIGAQYGTVADSRAHGRQPCPVCWK